MGCLPPNTYDCDDYYKTWTQLKASIVGGGNNSECGTLGAFILRLSISATAELFYTGACLHMIVTGLGL